MADRADGQPSRAPATGLDHRQGGTVRLDHIAAGIAEESILDFKLTGTAQPMDNGGRWRSNLRRIPHADAAACPLPLVRGKG
jgi:hypothetical protein